MSNATQNCEFCQSPAHIWFNCPKKPDGWKPDRLKKSTARPTAAAQVTTPERTLTDRRGAPKRAPAAVSPASRKAVAKNVGQSGQEAAVEPPVDTLKQAETAAAHLAPKSKGGRPKVHEDRKAYRAKKAKEYRERDRLKAAKEAK